MSIDKFKLDIAMANAKMNAYDLCKAAGIQYQTLHRATKGNPCKPATIGKVAKALDVDVEKIVAWV